MDECIVWLSGGKDSAVVLDLVCEQFDGANVVALQLYQGADLAFERVATSAISRRYGLREHILWPHPSLVAYQRAGRLGVPRLDSLQAVKQHGHADLEWLARETTGMLWTISGQRKMDSLHRRGMLTRWGALDRKHHRCHPIADWNDSETYSYLMARKLPTVSRFGKRVRVSGLTLTPDVLADIEAKHPDDFARLVDIYPFLPALQMHATMQHAHEVPE